VNVTTRDAALIVGANAIPLLGVVLAGWDAFTLLMLYWFESAVIGIWVCVSVAMGDGRIEMFGATGDKGGFASGTGMALFIAAHAGIFMFVHLFFLFGFASINNVDEPGMDVLLTLLIDKGLWLPVAGLFVLRGLVTVSDKLAGRPAGPVVLGFYLRIVVMQFVILLGGFFAILMGGSIVPLLILVALRIAIDVGIEPISQHVGASVARARKDTSAATD
jgi:hypothetical protein